MKLIVPAAMFALGAATAIAAQHFARRNSTAQAPSVARSLPPSATEGSQDLNNEQFSRICSFFGEDGFAKIQDAFVIVIGLGGVGSHAAHMLARSGVKKLRLIDFDNVTLSSLNRHAVATRADVGLSKATVLKNHLHAIVPQCEVEALSVMFEEDVADELLSGNPTYILDCIDDVTTKTALLVAACTKGLKVITATGAGGKADPTRIHIGTLHDAVRDPLATKIRYFLKKKGVDASLITTVYSSEKTIAKLLPLDAEQAADPGAFGNVENFRIRVIPVLGTMPAMFGQSMAAFVLTEIAGLPISPENVPKLGRDMRNKYYQRLQQREKDLGFGQKITVDKDDMDFIYQEIWKARSAVSGIRCGGFDRMFMTRWRKELPLSPGNIVILTTKELMQMDAEGIESFGADVVARVDARLASFGSWDV
ncbi:ubiquitin-activating enzyme (E1) [Achlya hypogyna]|uniref:Secreted protein n=1 Tax=Achlya hypogyna TaxID=1202772 RepID=A0A0A7CN03_ACHHY|nr:secreted protein [Achlya hypogyna]OQR94368.1 ubiquitin-activating enzyme (E1) [Achlya hypogyna]